MTISIVSRVPEVVPHKVVQDVKSFIVSSEGISIIRYIHNSGTLVSDWFAFGSIFVGVSYDKE